MIGRFVQRGMIAGAAFVALALQLSAAEGGPEAARVSYRVTRYTAEQGLPQNTIRALLQTRDGYLWVGTLAGLARFDGVRFKVFNVSNTPEMVNDAIDALAEDRRDGSLWINAGQRLLRYHQHRFERFDEQQDIPHAFGRLWPARQGGLWYSPRPNLLVLLQNRSARTWSLGPEREPGDAAYDIIQVEEEEAGSLLTLMNVGLHRFKPATGVLTRLGPSDLTDTRHFLRQTNGTILVAAQQGLWRGSEAGWERIETVPPGDRQCPVQIYPASNGDLWIPWGINVPGYPDWLPPRLARFRAGRSEFVDLSALPDYPLTEFLQDREGHLWLGTESGLCQLRPKAVRVYAREDGLRNDYVKSLTEGPDGTIWLGTAEGVSGIKDGQVTNLPPVEPLNWGRAEGLLADRRGRVWYGMHYPNAVAFEHGAWTSPVAFNSQQGRLRTLYEDRLGRIWAGFDRGAACLSEAGALQDLAHALSHPDVRVIHEDRRGDFWFGTYGGGLNRLHDGQITSYTTTLGEYNNRMWCIHEDADGVFWVGSRNGLNRFVPPGVEEVRSPKSQVNSVGSPQIRRRPQMQASVPFHRRSSPNLRGAFSLSPPGTACTRTSSITSRRTNSGTCG